MLLELRVFCLSILIWIVLSAPLIADYLRINVFIEDDLSPVNTELVLVEQIRLDIDLDLERSRWFMEIPGETNFSTKSAWNIDETVIEINPAGTLVEVSAYNNGHPIHLFAPMRLAWLVYVAEEYIRRNEGKQVVLPRGDPRHDLDILSTTINVQWEGYGYITPAQADFLFDEELLADAPTYLSLQPLDHEFLLLRGRFYQQLRDGFSTGQRMASLIVDEWIEYREYYIPKEWTYEEYSSDGTLRRLIKGVTEELSSVSAIRVGQIPESVSVHDLRFRSLEDNINAILYDIDDGVIPPRDDEWLISIAQPVSRERATITFEPFERKDYRGLVIVIILLVMIAPFALAYFLSVATRRTNEKTDNNNRERIG